MYSTIRCPIREAINNIEYVNLQKRTQVNLNALSMVINFGNYTHTSPKVSLGFIFGGVIFGKIFELVYRGANIREGLYSGFYRISLDLQN